MFIFSYILGSEFGLALFHRYYLSKGSSLARVFELQESLQRSLRKNGHQKLISVTQNRVQNLFIRVT